MNEIGRVAFTRREFCFRNHISLTKYHDLLRNGLGPRTMLGRITEEAEKEWQRQMEERDASEAVQLARQRRVEIAKRAGKIAAASPLHVSNAGSRKNKKKKRVRA
jgi:hypothetical protein